MGVCHFCYCKAWYMLIKNEKTNQFFKYLIYIYMASGIFTFTDPSQGAQQAFPAPSAQRAPSIGQAELAAAIEIHGPSPADAFNQFIESPHFARSEDTVEYYAVARNMQIPPHYNFYKVGLFQNPPGIGGGGGVDTQYFCKLDENHDDIYPNTLPPFSPPQNALNAVAMETRIDKLNFENNLGLAPEAPAGIARAAVDRFFADYTTEDEDGSRSGKRTKKNKIALMVNGMGPILEVPTIRGNLMVASTPPTPTLVAASVQFGTLLLYRIRESIQNDGRPQIVQIDHGAESSIEEAVATVLSRLRKDVLNRCNTPGTVYDTGESATESPCFTKIR